MSKKPVLSDLSFLAWRVILLEAAIGYVVVRNR